MVVICLFATCAAAAARGAGPIAWETDLAVARQKAAASNRLVLIHFAAAWCPPCIKLEQTVFQDPQFAQAVQQFYVPVKLNVDDHHQLAENYGVRGIPADVVTLPDGRALSQSVSPDSAAAYAAALNQMAQHAASVAAASPTGQRPAQSNHPHQPQYANQPVSRQPPASRQDQYGQNRHELARGRPNPPPGGGENSGRFGEPRAAPVGPRYGHPGQPAPGTPVARYGAPPANAGPPPAGPPAPRNGAPPLAFFGYCVVTMYDEHRWVKADPQWGVIHQQRLYLFASPQAKQQFFQEPHRFAPVLDGHDVVLFAETGRLVPGRRNVQRLSLGVTYQAPWEQAKRIYLFADQQTLQKFTSNPEGYVHLLQQHRRRPHTRVDPGNARR